jgi:hypothetical protein
VTLGWQGILEDCHKKIKLIMIEKSSWVSNFYKIRGKEGRRDEWLA